MVGLGLGEGVGIGVEVPLLLVLGETEDGAELLLVGEGVGVEGG